MSMLNCDLNDPEVQESLHFLMVSKEEKAKAQAQPFDGKKSCWIAEPREGFIAAEIQSVRADAITVRTCKGDTVTLKKEEVSQMNPPKYDKCEDMAHLTYLNDATVLHNLRSRYSAWLIYTYSGLFCVAINPYRRLPVYTMKMVAFYRGKKKSEVPPHLYFIADNAYASMLKDRENQSLLIT
jgi:myosin heavy chain 6/7